MSQLPEPLERSLRAPLDTPKGIGRGCQSNVGGVLPKQTTELQSGQLPHHMSPQGELAWPVSEPCREQVPASPHSPAREPSRACAALLGRKLHTRLPWLERMGWGREAEVGATAGGELLGLTQGAAESRQSSPT